MLKAKVVRNIVPWSLGQIGHRSAIPPFIKTLDGKDQDMFDGLIPVAVAARLAITKLERKP